MTKNIIRKVKKINNKLGKIFAIYITNKRLISPVHKDLLKFKDSRVIKNPIETWTLTTIRHKNGL